MRKYFIGILSAFLLFSCTNNQGTNGFSINGEIKNYAKQKLFLEEVSLNDGAVTIDTAITDGDGEFSIKGNVREKSIYRIRLQNSAAYFLILNQNEKINFSANAETPVGYTVSGSAESEALKKLIDTIASNNQKLDALKIQYIEMQKKFASDSALKTFKNMADAKVNLYMNEVKIFIDTTHYNLAAIFAVSVLNPEKDLATVNKLSERLQKQMPDSKYTKDFIKKYGNIVEDLVGKHFKEIELPSFDKKYIKFSSIKNKWVLLDFWASWCPPCRRENPNLVKAYQKFKSKNFTVFSVSLDDNDGKWFDAVKADHLDWKTHVSELKGWESKVCKDYYINQIPTNFLISPEGIIVARDLRGEELQKKLEEVLLKKNS